jgi:hypothetical protein
MLVVPTHALDREVAYLVAAVDSLEPTASLLRRHRSRCADASAIHVCREIPRPARPRDLPLLSAADHDGALDESWSTRPVWLAEWLRDVSVELAQRLIVRVDWPIPSHVEATLLVARLTHPGLRIAVEVTGARATEIFHYMSRLGFAWLALPRAVAPSGEWRNAAAQLASLWCFDPGTSVAVEPIVSAFRAVIGERVRGDESFWTCRIVHERTPSDDVLAWTPTLHTILTAAPSRATLTALDWIASADRDWISDLVSMTNAIDLDRLSRVLASSEPAATPERTHDA